MSKILMRRRFNHDQNPDIKNFDYKLQNQSTLESEQSILMSRILMQTRFDHDHNPNIENFDAT
jgi:hypothetical protein